MASATSDNSSLKAKSAWLISDGKKGSDAQCEGIAKALGLNYEFKHVAPKGIWKIGAPWLPPSPKEKIGAPESQFSPPWPTLIMAASRRSIPYLRAVRKAAKGETYAVVLLDPKTGPSIADILWVPQHDRLRGPNVITTLTAPHAFSPARLKELREELPPALQSLPRPFVMVALGGKNAVYNYSEATIKRFETSLTSLASQGVTFLITPSRRTPPDLISAVKRATTNTPGILFENDGPNPYPDFLAHADMLIVTADSISMTSEACATGKPVYIFEPDGGSAKFTRFHSALNDYGATRPLPTHFEKLDFWQYIPLYSTDEIASKIEEDWRKRQSRL